MAKRKALKTELRRAISSENGLELLKSVVGVLRPVGSESADGSVALLIDELSASPEMASTIRAAAAKVLGSARLVHALAESGILADRGFWTSLKDRISQSVLPYPSPENDIRRQIRAVFNQRGDAAWLVQVDPDLWRRLFSLLVEPDDVSGIPHEDVAAAIVGLAQRAGALGIDEEVNARLHQVEDYRSPFLELTPLASRFLKLYASNGDFEESWHLLVDTIAECRELIQRLRANKKVYGTSVRLTSLSRRLLQLLRRLEILLHLVRPQDLDDYVESLVPVVVELVEGELTSRSIRRLVVESADTLAFQITEHTAKKGTKYITDSKRGYWDFLRAAMLGGAIVAIFAIGKGLLSTLDFSLAGQALAYSFNYAACFVLIYLTGSILATKQPAVTASAIAQCMDEAQTESDALEAVGNMVVRVWRSQFVSFVGNLICAFPVAILGVWLYQLALGTPVADATKASKLLADVHPLESGALFYAGVAGVFLFLSGVISGWVDNLVVYSHLKARLLNRKLFRSLGERGEKLATFISSNIGMLTGNILLGFFLGTAGTLGFILGLPFDIRHIAFSSANVGMAVFSAPELLTPTVLAWAVGGVIAIGFINFVVSFGLTLVLTLESRQTSFGQWRRLTWLLFRRFLRRPWVWFLPPRRRPTDQPAGG